MAGCARTSEVAWHHSDEVTRGFPGIALTSTNFMDELKENDVRRILYGENE